MQIALVVTNDDYKIIEDRCTDKIYKKLIE